MTTRWAVPVPRLRTAVFAYACIVGVVIVGALDCSMGFGPRPCYTIDTCGGTGSKVALTFDDGPGVLTSHLLDVLKGKGVKATFFISGFSLFGVGAPRIDAMRALVRRAFNEGHQIANHGYKHLPFTTLNFMQQLDELNKCAQTIQQITGEKPRFFRPPFGSLNAQTEQAIHNAGYHIVLWNIDPQEPVYCNPKNFKADDPYKVGFAHTGSSCRSVTMRMIDDIVERRSAARSRGEERYDPSVMVLQHDIFDETVNLVGEMIDKLRGAGMQFVRVDQCFDYGPGSVLVTGAGAAVNFPIVPTYNKVGPWGGSVAGGTSVTIQGANFDTSQTSFVCVFSLKPTNRFHDGKARPTARSPAVRALSNSMVVCKSPAWIARAGHVQVGLEYSGVDVQKTALEHTLVFLYQEEWTGAQQVRGNSGTSITIVGAGFDSSDASYKCVFANAKGNWQSVSSKAVKPLSHDKVACLVPMWPFSGIKEASLSLYKGMQAVPRQGGKGPLTFSFVDCKAPVACGPLHRHPCTMSASVDSCGPCMEGFADPLHNDAGPGGNSRCERGAPRAPTVKSVDAGNGEVTVHFEPAPGTEDASDGSVVFYGYEVTAVPGDVVAQARHSPIAVTGLSNGVSYTFTVVALNSKGRSPKSNVSSPAVPSGPAAPPTSVVAAVVGDTISLKITPPPAVVGILGYRATSAPGGIMVEVQGAQTTAITYPAPKDDASPPLFATGVSYTFTVASLNSAGAGPPSRPSNSVLPVGRPGAPLLNLVSELHNEKAAVPSTDGGVPVGGAGVMVHFSPPVSDGGARITRYRIMVEPGGFKHHVSPSGASQLSGSVYGLTQGQAYTVTVAARNEHGYGVASPSYMVTLNGRPAAPTNVKAVSGINSIILSWDAPSSKDDSIRRYIVVATPFITPIIAKASPLVVSVQHGLDPQIEYSFTVTAESSIGAGNPSEGTKPVRALGPPAAPAIIQALPEDGAVLVTFTLVKVRGGDGSTELPPVKYTIVARPGGHAASGNASPIRIGGLTNGVPYTFTVIASVSQVGMSPPSLASLPATPQGGPPPPKSVSATLNPGAKTVSVTWDMLEVKGDEKLTYAVIASPPLRTSGVGDTVSTQEAPPLIALQSPAILSGLMVGQSYTFTVQATVTRTTEVNGRSRLFDFKGKPSLPSNNVVLQGVADPPVITGVFPGDKSLIVNFLPSPNSGGLPIDGYEVFVNAADMPTVTLVVQASPATVSGLRNGIPYTVEMRALNGKGKGPVTLPSPSVLPRGRPGAPTIERVDPVSGGALIHLKPPASTGGSPIRLYMAKSNPGNFVGQAITSPVAVSGLDNGKQYTFSVIAVSDGGDSEPAVTSSSTIPIGLPGPPTIRSVTAGNAQLIAVIEAHDNTGGTVVQSFKVTATPVTSESAATTARVIEASGPTSPVSVSGLENGLRYVLTAKVINIVGESIPSAPSFPVMPAPVPATPRLVKVVVESGRAFVHFEPPSNAAGIVGYRAVSEPDNFAGTGVRSPVEVSGLTNGKSYSFRVMSLSSYQGKVITSLPSRASISSTPTERPGAPQLTKVVSRDSAIVVNFLPPANAAASAVLGYTATAQPGGKFATGVSSPLTITGLTNGVIYTVMVTAKTSAQNASVESGRSRPVMPFGQVPPPSDIRMVAADGRVTIEFDHVLVPDLEAESIKKYHDLTSPITYKVVASPPTSPPSFSSSESPIVYTGLKNGVEYTFTLTAQNEQGVSQQAITRPITPMTTPDPPTIRDVQFTKSVKFPGSRTKGAALLALVPPAKTGGDRVENISYVCSSQPASKQWVFMQTTGVFDELDIGVSYVFTCETKNSLGVSVPSKQSAVYIPMAQPSPPTITFVIAQDQSVQVGFELPTQMGGSSVNTCTAQVMNHPELKGEGTKSPLVVKGLTNGETYRLTMTCVNKQNVPSDASAPSKPVTPIGPPGTPMISKITSDVGVGIIEFTPPADIGGSEILHYLAVASPGDYKSVGLTSPLRVEGLSNLSSYSFTLTAINAAGNGLPTAPFGPVQILPAPYSPVITEVPRPASHAVTVYFTHDSRDRSPAVSFRVTSSPGGVEGTGSSSPVTVKGLSNGVSYTFTVQAVDGGGRHSVPSKPSAAVRPSGPPLPPSITGVKASNREVTVSFSPPLDDGGFPITSYTVTSDPERRTASGPTSPITMKGLTNGVHYSFTVMATNEKQLGSRPSEASVKVLPVGIPSAPSITKVELFHPSTTGADGEGKNGIAGAQVSFSAPSDTGGVHVDFSASTDEDVQQVLWFTVTSSPGGLTATGVSSPIVVPYLHHGVSYTFTITAATAAGTSPASSPSASFTYIAPVSTSLPGPPTKVFALSGDGQATISFEAPEVDGDSSAITAYHVTAFPGGHVQQGPKSPVVFKDLNNGVAYTFTVAAVNAQGVGTASAPSAVTVPIGKPSAPFMESAEASSLGIAGVADVAFLPPVFTGGSDILLYKVESSAGSAGSKPITGEGTASPVTVKGLVSGNVYRFKVAACNIAGCGDFSEMSNTVLPAGVPGKGKIDLVVPVQGGLRVYFSPPANEPAILGILKYDVTSYPGRITMTSTSSPVVFKGLYESTAYSFTVVSYNRNGPGPVSAASKPQRPLFLPGKPLLYDLRPENEVMRVLFTAPRDGSYVTEYVVRVLSVGGVPPREVRGKESPILVENLVNGRVYRFTVAAVNAMGVGAMSDPMQGVPRSSVSVPAFTRILPADRKIIVEFEPSVLASRQGVIRYDGTASPVGGRGSVVTAQTGVSPMTFFNVDNDVPYTVVIKVITARSLNVALSPAEEKAATATTVPSWPVTPRESLGLGYGAFDLVGDLLAAEQVGLPPEGWSQPGTDAAGSVNGFDPFSQLDDDAFFDGNGNANDAFIATTVGIIVVVLSSLVGMFVSYFAVKLYRKWKEQQGYGGFDLESGGSSSKKKKRTDAAYDGEKPWWSQVWQRVTSPLSPRSPNGARSPGATFAADSDGDSDNSEEGIGLVSGRTDDGSVEDPDGGADTRGLSGFDVTVLASSRAAVTGKKAKRARNKNRSKASSSMDKKKKRAFGAKY